MEKKKKIVKKENKKLIAFTDEAMAILKREIKNGTPLTEVVNNLASSREVFNPVAEARIKEYEERFGATRGQAIEALVLGSFLPPMESQKGEGRPK